MKTVKDLSENKNDLYNIKIKENKLRATGCECNINMVLFRPIRFYICGFIFGIKDIHSREIYPINKYPTTQLGRIMSGCREEMHKTRTVTTNLVTHSNSSFLFKRDKEKHITEFMKRKSGICG